MTAVRSASSLAVLHGYQLDLLREIEQLERYKGECQRALKRVGAWVKEGQVSAEDIRAQPALAELLALRRSIWALRRLGDSIALRLLGYDRFYVHVVGLGQHSGESSSKAGTAAEVRVFEDAWNRGEPAILHAVTTTLRLGDVSVRGPAGWLPVEVKSDARRRPRGAQAARLRRTAAFLRTGIDTSGPVAVARYDFATTFRHHLPLFADILSRAIEAGAAGVQLEDYGNALAIDVRTLSRLPVDEGARRIEAAQQQIALETSDVSVRAWSDDRQRATQFGVPYTSYPFPPDICAALSCAFLSLTVILDLRRIALHLERAGFRTEVVAHRGADWFRVHRGRDSVGIPEGIGERLLYEAMQPAALVDALEEMVARTGSEVRTVGRIVPLFAREDEVWA